MKNNINPKGLKGNEAISRMKDLMGIKPITENTIERSEALITKKGPDNKIYAIIRENHKYHIKSTTNKSNLVVEDFQYNGGLVNKHKSGYSSYAEAIKQLNLTFISLSESLGLSNTVNSFLNDNILKENNEMPPEPKEDYKDQPSYVGVTEEEEECEDPISETEGTSGIVRGAGHDTHIMENDVELTPVEEAVDNMIAANKDNESIDENFIQNKRLKIGDAINNITTNESKNSQVNDLIKSLSTNERLALIEALKKKA